MKVSGAKELEVWGETEREHEAGGLWASPAGRTLRERVSEEYASAKRGARSARLATDLPPQLVRHLEVEAAFVRLAVSGAIEYLGLDPLRFKFADLDSETRALYSELVERGAQAVRHLCVHVYVNRRPLGKYKRDSVYVHMALYGVSRHGFTCWLRDRLAAVKAEIELKATEGYQRDFQKKSEAS